MSIQKLIDQTYSYIIEASGDLKEVYQDDYDTFVTVQNFLDLGDRYGAAALVEEMDTEPREAVLMALIEDYGVKWVENKFAVRVI